MIKKIRTVTTNEKVSNMKRIEILYPKDLKQMFNICRATVANWERDRRLPPRDVFNNDRPVGWLPQTLKQAETKG